MILTFKYRVRDKRAKKTLAAYALGSNAIWNYANALQKQCEDRYRAGSPNRRWPTHFDLTGLTAGCTKELGIHADTVGEVCRQFAQSRNVVGYSLRFRSSFGSRRSLGWVPFRGKTIRAKENAVTYLGKTFRLFGTKSRPLPLKIKTGAFVEDARGRWFVCLTADVENLPTGTGIIGIDLGLKTLATMSDGSTVPALQHYRRHERSLAAAQRAGDKRRMRSIHAKIRDVRRDQMHKATTKIAKDNKLIIIGNVSASKLAKTRMAKSVLDAGWFQFKSQLEAKARRHQADFIVVDEANTSRSCSDCGAVCGPAGIAGLGIRAWECIDCGASHDRDVNAARNILRLGLSVQARADEIRRTA